MGIEPMSHLCRHSFHDDAGRRPRTRIMDLLIAATAHRYAARLCTRNAADLVRLEQLVDIASV
jgi:predicted nucleic acid-binding protein